MAEQRMALWVAEAELDDDLQEVDPSLAIGNYGQNGHYDDGALIVVRNNIVVRLISLLFWYFF
jgi:hypothetical protein